MRSYIALIHKETKSDFGVSFPDFPGCVTAGTTLQEAMDMAAEALALHIEGMIEDGAAIPEPSPLEAVMAEPENRDGVAVLVPAPDARARTVRINITMPEDVLEAIDAHAEREGYSRSGFIAQATKAAMNRAGKPLARKVTPGLEEPATPYGAGRQSRRAAVKAAGRATATRRRGRNKKK